MSAKTKTAKTETAKTETTEKPAKKGWRIKAYYVDTAAHKAASEELSKAPNQVKIMMAHFAEKFGKEDLAAQGKIMCQSAIDNGGLKTVIDPAVLFAYYRKTMEAFGLRLRG